MKRETFFRVVLVVCAIGAILCLFALNAAFGQTVSPYTLYGANNVASWSLTVSDTAVAGHSLRAEFTPGSGTTLVPAVVWKRNIAAISVPQKIRWWAFVPEYADAPNCVFSLKGEGGQATTIFVSLQKGGWQQYELAFNLSGFSTDTFFVGISSSDLSGRKVVFIDDVTAVYSNGDTVVIEDGEEDGEQPVEPQPPVITQPQNGSTVTIPVTVSWSQSVGATSYCLQVLQGTTVVVDQATTMTSVQLSLLAGTAYTVRVNASNTAGTSDWATVTFTTESNPPVTLNAPMLLSPMDEEVDVPVNAQLSWGAVGGATSYYIEVATTADFEVVVYGANVTTTSAITIPLQYKSTFFWRVRATNGVILSPWSSSRSFATVDWVATAVDSRDAVPLEFRLEQNYPNPFNPTTTINYNVARQSRVKLVVYNMLGREVATLVDGVKSVGNYSYSVRFDAANLGTGTYIYRMSVGDKVFTKKMILLK